MTKRSYFLIGLLVGLLSGLIIGGTIIYARVTARFRQYQIYSEIAEAARYELGDWDAGHAYYNESRPVAIYALSQDLLRLGQEEKDAQINPFLSDVNVAVGMVITHGRLAKLYAEAGETNLEAQNVAQALNWGKKTAHWRFTNEMELTNWIAKGDRLEERLNKRNTNMAPDTVQVPAAK